MRALLDVNVLIALLDADHSLHARSRGGLEAMHVLARFRQSQKTPATRIIASVSL